MIVHDAPQLSDDAPLGRADAQERIIDAIPELRGNGLEGFWAPDLISFKLCHCLFLYDRLREHNPQA
jgi:hypothetical protein